MKLILYTNIIPNLRVLQSLGKIYEILMNRLLLQLLFPPN